MSQTTLDQPPPRTQGPSGAADSSDSPVPPKAPGLLGRAIRTPQFAPLVAAAVLYIFFALETAGRGFVSASGTASWLNTGAQLGIIAIPIALLIIAGEFDLSIGSMVGASSITIGIVAGHYHESLWLGVAIVLVLAVAVGVINGLLVTRTDMPSFIVTLATNLILVGLSLTVPQALMGNTSVGLSPSGLVKDVFAGEAGQFQVAIIWWFAIILVAGWVLAKTRFGNWIFATGGSSENARRAGVPTGRVKISLFVSTAVAAALVGIIQAIQYATGDGTTGQGYVFEAPIVVVIGGVLLMGGYGTISGVVIATVLYGFVNAGLFYTGWDTNYAQVVIGTLMVVAVLSNNFVRRLVLSSARSAVGR